MKILFLTTLNFATNPRLLKEVRLAINRQHKVQVICFEFDNWSKQINNNIINDLKASVDIIIIEAGRKPFIPWLISSLLQEVSKIVGNIIKNPKILAYAISKRSYLLLSAVKELQIIPDLVIGHNPGSFYPAYYTSVTNHIPFAVDLEDYHPGETTNRKSAERMINLLKFILPKVSWFTAASKSILAETLLNFPGLKIQHKVILNANPEIEFSNPNSISGAIRFVWFSQNISSGRGLEDVLPYFKKYDDKIELHLFGNISDRKLTALCETFKNIYINKPLPQKELHKSLAYFDCGLAVEPGKDLNNTLAVSNKLIAFLQAGLFVYASDTIGQQEILRQFPDNGIIVEKSEDCMEAGFIYIMNQITNIRKNRIQRHLSNKSLSWEVESEELIQLWQYSLKSNKLNNKEEASVLI